MQVLADLSEPQVALLLAARRLLVRASHGSYAISTKKDNQATANDNADASTACTLCLDRLLEECKTATGQGGGGRRGGSSGGGGANAAGGITNRYSQHVLSRAFLDMLDIGILRPAMDHSGEGPFQYDYYKTRYANLDCHSLGRMPLHLTFDLHREILKALESNILQASTALLEWGKKII